jgi:hypothetical protein
MGHRLKQRLKGEGHKTMEEKITLIVSYIAFSHRQLSRILEAKRDTAARMAGIIDGMPDKDPVFYTVEATIEHAQHLTKSIVAYLNSLAELEEALAQQTEIALKEFFVHDDGE